MTDLPPRMLRRDMLRTTLNLAGSGCILFALGSEQVAAQAKIAKVVANYQDHPHGQQRCEACAYYLPPVACQLVRGEVSPNGWCSQFQANA
jgi:hypothetical protein